MENGNENTRRKFYFLFFLPNKTHNDYGSGCLRARFRPLNSNGRTCRRDIMYGIRPQECGDGRALVETAEKRATSVFRGDHSRGREGEKEPIFHFAKTAVKSVRVARNVKIKNKNLVLSRTFRGFLYFVFFFRPFRKRYRLFVWSADDARLRLSACVCAHHDAYNVCTRTPGSPGLRSRGRSGRVLNHFYVRNYRVQRNEKTKPPK